MTVQQFITFFNIKMTATPVPANPWMDAPQWTREAKHYHIRLSLDDKTFDTWFSMGSGLKGRPKAAEVLDSIAVEASLVEDYSSLNEWTANIAQGLDAEEGLINYLVCRQQRSRLIAWLGLDKYATLLHDTERL